MSEPSKKPKKISKIKKDISEIKQLEKIINRYELPPDFDPTLKPMEKTKSFKDDMINYCKSKMTKYGVQKIIGKVIGDKILITKKQYDFVNDCIKQGKNPYACSIGGMSSIAISKATDAMSTALITTSLTHPIGFITAPVGTYGLIKSSEFGQQMGNVVANAVDYLTDNVPYQMIDASKPVLLTKGDISIEFAPKEIKFVRGLVKANQHVERETALIYKQGAGVLKQANDMHRRTKRVTKEFKETTQKAKVVIGDLKLIKSLDKAVLPTLTERMTGVCGVSGHVPHINTHEMTRPMPYMETRGNTTGVYVHCDNHRGHGGGEWKCVFAVTVSFVPGVGFALGGGGCSLL